MIRPCPLASLLLLLLLLPAAAVASDGMLEINQTCAVQTGCFVGDTPGLPVTITKAGSYRLTSNLTTGSRLVTAISVAADDVSIDLGGFTIACAFGQIVPLACLTSTSGFGRGVFRTSVGISGTSVKNGSVTGMGGNGIHLGIQAEVVSLRVHSNGSTGIVTGAHSMISANTVRNNASGIVAGNGSTVSGNTVGENSGDGIFGDTGSTISGNTAYLNGNTGIRTGSGVSVQRNTVRSNTGFGLSLATDSAYRENVITGNTAGTVFGGVNLFSNSCNGTTVCP